MDRKALGQKAGKILKRLGAYKYVLLVIAAGLALLLWPERSPQAAMSSDAAGETFSVEAMQEQMADILGRIDGAGKVTVMLTVKTGMERILAQDGTYSEDEERTETVVISTGSGKQETVVLSCRYPAFQGALVVCPGGDDLQVKLLITQAVSALTGLGTAKIMVCKGG